MDFHDKSPSTLTSPQLAPEEISELKRTASLTSIHSKDEELEQQSLLKRAPPSYIQLPKAATIALEHENLFTPGHLSAATHFPKPADPKGFVRSDAHVPEWGGNVLFNQPQSRADPAPPDTILDYAKAQERAQAMRERIGTPRGLSPTDPRWASDFSVVPAIQGNGGLTNAVNMARKLGNIDNTLTVGLIGFPTNSLKEDTKQNIYETLEEDLKALTIFVSDKDFDGHYAHYCKTILWPVFNYIIPDHPKSKAFLDHSWVYYVKVNQAFADRIVEDCKEDDVIWIHDYHLCLVPEMIREKRPHVRMGFFLHTAFPSSEVFRCLAARKELLCGMLGANLVAFQTQEYAHHFLQTCSRILSVEATEEGIQLENRFVNVGYAPIGTDPAELQNERQEPEVAKWIQIMLKRYEGKKIIVARDKLDSIRGVRQKLLAFELFLNKYPEWKEKVVLIQVATSTTEDADLATTVSEIVSRIDAHHTTLTHSPLVFLRQDIAFSQFLAMLSVADALAITSLREGMNLTVHEFIMCQDGQQSPKMHSPVILSEFTGSASIFEGNELSVNPWDYANIANAFKTALEMSPEEKARRYQAMRQVVLRQTGDAWISDLSRSLEKVHEEHTTRDAMKIPRLSQYSVSQGYSVSRKRLFLLDYEGTLSSYGSVNSTVIASTERIVNVLNELASNKRNIVYVMSGRTVRELELVFNRARGVGLIAENGCVLREPNAEEWLQFPDENKLQQWKGACKSIFKYYLERVEGSELEEFHCSLVFKYEKSKGDEVASRHAGDCANHINDACEQQRVKAVPTKDSVIIEHMDYDKSTAARHIFDKFHLEQRPDFIFVAGNDRTDECVFRWAKECKDESITSVVETVTVGNRHSIAMSTITNGTTGSSFHGMSMFLLTDIFFRSLGRPQQTRKG